jgi:hypothetical protein
MRAFDGLAAGSPVVRRENPSILSRLTGVQSRRGVGDSSARERQNRGRTTDLASAHPPFCDIGMLGRARRVPENKIIALNDQGSNSRRVA